MSGNQVEFDPPNPLPQDTEEFREVIREYLEVRYEAGHRYVKTRHIKRGLDMDSPGQKIGFQLMKLQEEGVIEKWRSDGSPITYEINPPQDNE
jgi:hypothetical protein